MGYMGCGKSVIGKRLAERKSIDFIDLDDYIEAEEKPPYPRYLNKREN